MDLKNAIIPDGLKNPYYDYDRYLFQIFKKANLIEGYYFTFIYDDYIYEDNSKYFDENYHNILGQLIIGEAPHEFNPEKYEADDEIKIYQNFSEEYVEFKFKTKISNYSEENTRISFGFRSAFIKGNNNFKNEIDNIFFDELISRNICRFDVLGENIVITKDIVYSCENNQAMKEKMKYFPTIYFEVKPSNLTFLFSYKELFKLYHDRLYFLIYFKNTSYSHNEWEFGELFFRKYTISFNYDSKTLSFYKKQVDDINKKTDVIYPDEKGNDEPEGGRGKESWLSTRVIIEIIMGVVILISIVIIILFIIRWKRIRKKRAAELKDDDYEYMPEGLVN